MNWKRLRKNIPNKARTTAKKSFEILWSEGLFDTQGTMLYGKTEFDPDRIILNTTQKDKDAVLTAWHELIHAFDHAHEIGLTETQVVKLEKTFVYVMEFIMILEGKKK